MDKSEVNAIANLSEEDIKKELSILRTSYEMYERTKYDTIEKRKSNKGRYSEESTKKTLELIQEMQDDVKEKYEMLGGNPDELYVTPKKNTKNKKKLGHDYSRFEEIMKREMAKIDEEDDDSFAVDVVPVKPKITKKVTVENTVETQRETTADTVKNGKELSSINMDITKAKGSNNIKYDEIPIPSMGKCYRHKKSKIPVSYLTAYDENLILSPNLYQDGTFLDHILKRKIMTTKVDTDELIPGDREAILVWLRASGYGPLYPVTAKDENGREFRSEVDLSTLKFKDFNLEADEDGYFDFVMPNLGDEIKFKFLSYKDIKELSDLSIKEDATLRKNKIAEVCGTLSYYLEDDNTIDIDDKTKVNGAIKTLSEFGEKIEADPSTMFNNLVTNRMAMSIVSVNGVTDRNYIEDYVTTLNVKDAMALRKYIAENEPGLDLNIKLKKPESLGGGSMDFFLQFDQYLFLNT